MKRFAVVGKDINYSISPFIHNFNFEMLNIDATYELWNLNNLHDNVKDLRELNGFNVTIPYKEDVYNLCDIINEEAKDIGAVNCVKVVDNKFYGFNTDVYGFYQLLLKNQLLEKKLNVLIIGSGGAAKAVYYCIKKYTNHIAFVSNRTSEKAKLITSNTILYDQIDLIYFDIVINCTNVGVKTYIAPIEIKKIKLGSVFIDINYQTKSKFLDDASKLNAKTINGQDMLIYQAAKSYEIWFEKQANINYFEESIRKG